MEIKVFKDTKELEKFVGVSHDDMWNIGFNLNDCDGAVGIKKTKETEKWFHPHETDIGYKRIDYDFWETPTIVDLILNSLNDYCVGCSSIEYNGYYYFLIHHS